MNMHKCCGATIYKFPRTPEGRDALRAFIPTKNSFEEPYPDGSYFADADWDEVAEQVKDLDRHLEEKERRGEL